MPYFTTSQEWLRQSALLFQAYPTSSRVTTKYTIHPPLPPDSRKRKRQPNEADAAAAAAVQTSTTTTSDPKSASAPQPPPPSVPKASLTLKTYDPVSGVCLKYRTDKAAEVGRLIASLGRLGKHMAALPDADADAGVVVGEVDGAVAAADGADAAEKLPGMTSDAVTGAGEGDAKAQQGKSGGGGGGGAGGKKKKKGKK